MPERRLKEFADVNLHKMPEWQLGWLAGMVDGEGCISLEFCGKCVVFITSTTQIGSVIKGITGMGNIRTDIPANKRCKPKYLWSLYSFAEIYTFLTKLLPYLIIKQKQAKVMIEYCKGRLDVMKRTGLKPKKPTSEYYIMLRVLNSRGKEVVG